MDEYQLNLDKGETIEVVKFDTIQIKQNEFKYDLNIKTKENIIYFAIKDKNQLQPINYKRSMSFKEIKELNVHHGLNSFQDFYDYLKTLSNNNLLNIKKSNDKISIIFNVEVLLKQQTIEIDLFPEKIDIDLNIKEIWEELLNIKEKMKENNVEIDQLKKENKELKAKIEEQNKEINELKEFKREMKSLIEEINFEN